MYGFIIMPAEEPQGNWIIEVPEAVASAVSAGTLTH
jgi:hypothetical protein